MNFKKEVRQLITKTLSTKEDAWQTFQKHSAEYAKVLNLSTSDLATLQQDVQERFSMYPGIEETGEKGFLKFSLEGEDFSLTAKHVCGSHYGGEWQDYIFAICMSSSVFNQTIGYGTTTISIVSADWHEKILTHLKNGGREARQLAIVHKLHEE